jgi:mRNA-degrading endonuclease RelE of RelBE toxin-antitoxin system
MRRFYYSPEFAERLADLQASDPEIDSIHLQVQALAKDPTLGYVVPLLLPSLEPSQTLYRYDVGRFGLIYTFTDEELEVVTVV